MAKSTMVSRLLKTFVKRTMIFFLLYERLKDPKGNFLLACSKQFVASSGMDHLRKNLFAKGLSEKSSNLSTNTRR